jgi:ubiquinone/menaquinone biosynthesis C-methylase UbiE
LGLYQRHLLPRLIHLGMRQKQLVPLRERMVGLARGRVLEIGLGSGLNLPFYGREIEELVAIDPSRELLSMARKHTSWVHFPVKLMECGAESLPLEDRSVDSVVMTWTLCSIGDPGQALAEIRRVLRPGAKLVVELMHRDRLVRGFSEQDWRLLGEGRLLLEQRTFDAAAGVAQTTQTLIDGGGERESRTFSVRVYSATELIAMLGRAGFEDVRCYGDLDGSPFGMETRLVTVAVSP